MCCPTCDDVEDAACCKASRSRPPISAARKNENRFAQEMKLPARCWGTPAGMVRPSRGVRRANRNTARSEQQQHRRATLSKLVSAARTATTWTISQTSLPACSGRSASRRAPLPLWTMDQLPVKPPATYCAGSSTLRSRLSRRGALLARCRHMEDARDTSLRKLDIVARRYPCPRWRRAAAPWSQGASGASWPQPRRRWPADRMCP